MNKKIKVILAGGGSGGHVFPLLNIWEYMKQDYDVLYIGEKNGKEEKWVTERGIKFQGVYAGKLRRYFDLRNIIDFFKVPIGIIQAINIIKNFKPQVVLVKGGYVSLPVAAAAWFMKIPVIEHESDLVMGLSNRIIAGIADKIAVSFPVGGYGEKYSNKMIYTGLPVREWKFKSGDVKKIKADLNIDNNLPTVFVTGGSHGAMKINSYVMEHAKEILKFANIVQVAGDLDYERVKKEQEKISGNGKYLVYGFLSDDFNRAMFVSEIVISRASATTLAEISSLAKPSILVPLPTSASNHQYFNARSFEDMGASVMIEERDFSKINLAVLISSILDDEERYYEMSSSASAAMQTEGAGLIILDLINDLVKK